jgi:hypothetical protein
MENVKLLKSNGDLLIEASPEKAGVGGSTPSLATISFNGLADQPEISHLWSLTVFGKRLSNSAG